MKLLILVKCYAYGRSVDLEMKQKMYYCINVLMYPPPLHIDWQSQIGGCGGEWREGAGAGQVVCARLALALVACPRAVLGTRNYPSFIQGHRCLDQPKQNLAPASWDGSSFSCFPWSHKL